MTIGSQISDISNRNGTFSPVQVVPVQVADISEEVASVSVDFSMNRNISTVHDAWNEYATGLRDNNTGLLLPSIKALESVGSKWRKSNTETQFFMRRKPLWQLIEKLLTSSSPLDKEIILNGLEFVRLNVVKQKTLRGLCKFIKESMTSIPDDETVFDAIESIIQAHPDNRSPDVRIFHDL